MKVIIYPGNAEGVVEAPPSKSYTHRAFFTSLLARGESVIVNALEAGDIVYTISAVMRFNATVHKVGNTYVVTGAERVDPHPWIYCGGSGTTIRIATAVASLASVPVLLYGNDSLNKRPMAPLIRALRDLGAKVVAADEGRPPLIVTGFGSQPRRKSVEIDGSISSQFITALLCIAPIIGLRIKVAGRFRSKPYVDVTLRVLKAYGAKVRREGYAVFEVEESGYKPAKFTIPGDYSSASFMLAAGALAGRVRVEGLDLGDVQADKKLVDVLKAMGAKVHAGGGWVEAEAPGELEGIEVDLSDAPDLAPVVASLAAHAKGVTRITNVGHLAYKESDRLAALRSNLSKLGIEVSVSGEDIVIRGGSVRGGTVSSYGDHRIAMAMAVLALRAEGAVEVLGFEKFRDSYPNFLRDISRLGVDYEVA